MHPERVKYASQKFELPSCYSIKLCGNHTNDKPLQGLSFSFGFMGLTIFVYVINNFKVQE